MNIKKQNRRKGVRKTVRKEPKVSVIIPSFNRKRYLWKTLPSYLIQEYVHEVIIVNDGSTEDYSELINYFTLEAKKRDINLICFKHKQREGAPAARNSGIKVSRSGLLLFSDDDVVLSSNFISKAVEKMLKLEVNIVGGRVIPVNDYHSIGKINHYHNVQKKVFDWLTLRGYYFVNTGHDIELPFVSAVSLWKRWIFDKGVRFDETYRGNGYREETSAQVEASKLGARIIFVPEMVSWHIRTERTGGQWRKSVLWWYSWAVRNNLRFLKKNYSYLRRRWDLKYPWWISFLAFSLRETSVLLPKPIKRVLRRLFRLIKKN